MFPFRGTLVILVLGIIGFTIVFGVTNLPGPASLTSITRDPVLNFSSMVTKNQSVTELNTLLQSNEDIMVIDVRSISEWEEAHIDHPNVQLIPLPKLIQNPNQINTESDVYVLCRSGNRSSIAQMILKTRLGIDVTNIEGGMNAWQSAGFPVSSDSSIR